MDVISFIEAYRTEAEATFSVPELNNDDKPITFHVAKLGGGENGEKHSGTWLVDVEYNGELVYSTQDLVTAMPHTHEYAGMVCADFLSAYGDPDSGYDGDNRPTGEALKFCQDNYDRLSLWAEPSMH